MKGNNLHLYTSNFTHETRILKETKSLSESGLFGRIFIAAIWSPRLSKAENLDEIRSVRRIQLFTRRFPPGFIFRLLRLFEWNVRVFLSYCNKQISVVSAHSLAVLPVALLFRIFCGARIVYETHELETERNGWSELKRILARILERALIRFVDQTVVVGDSIAKWYRAKYSIDNIVVVRNIPSTKPDPSPTRVSTLRKELGIAPGALIFLYQGILSSGRSIPVLMDIFSKLPERHLVLMGYGPLEDRVVKVCANHKNIHFLPAVSPEVVPNYTVEADVGLAIFENTSLSYYYSSPNKLFEYIVSGVPPLASDFPDMAALVDQYHLGWKVAPDAIVVEKLIKGITREEITEKRKNVLAACSNFTWATEAATLIASYRATVDPKALESFQPSHASD